MSTLYIRLPSKAVADNLQPGAALYCRYALASASGAVEREGVAALSELAEPLARAQRAVLLLAASDVTLLRVKLPPLSGARLKAALPNLIEDQLMSDPAECVIVPGDTVDGLRTVAVVHRGWLELLNRTLRSLGARSVTALPAQLCLPQPAEGASAAVLEEQGAEADVALRLAQQEGIGLPIAADQPELLAFEVLQSLAAVLPAGPLTLYALQPRVRDYQDALRLLPALEERVALQADDWPRWIAGADAAGPDLIIGLAGAAGARFDWRPWRWPLALALALLLVNAIALNVGWLRLKREAGALRTGMTQTYRNAFPKETVIADPLAQTRQKIAAARRGSGQLAPDDFLALAGAFGEAVRDAGQSLPIASLEYHERSLTVKPKDGGEPGEALRNALAAHNLSVSQPNAGVWQIRSVK